MNRAEVTRKSLRVLEESRVQLKWARVQLVAALSSVVAVVALWIAQLSTAWDGAGYGWKVVGLIVLALGAIGWSAGAWIYVFDCARKRRLAAYGYEDALFAYGSES